MDADASSQRNTTNDRMQTKSFLWMEAFFPETAARAKGRLLFFANPARVFAGERSCVSLRATDAVRAHRGRGWLPLSIGLAREWACRERV